MPTAVPMARRAMSGSRRPQLCPTMIVAAMAKPNTQANIQEHDDVGVGRRRQRILAEEAPHPDRVDRSVERLEHVRQQRRHGKGDQRSRDRPGGQVCARSCTARIRASSAFGAGPSPAARSLSSRFTVPPAQPILGRRLSPWRTMSCGLPCSRCFSFLPPLPPRTRSCRRPASSCWGWATSPPRPTRPRSASRCAGKARRRTRPSPR